MTLNKIHFLLIYLFFNGGYSLFSHPFHISTNELKLVEFKVTYESWRNLELLNERVFSEEFSGDTLLLGLVTLADCGQDFEVNINMINDTLCIHSKKAINEKEECECFGECGYKILLKIVGLNKEAKYNYVFNGSIIEYSNEKYTGRFLSIKKNNKWISKVVSLDSEIDTNLIYGNMALDEYPKVVLGDTLNIIEYVNKKMKEIYSKNKLFVRRNLSTSIRGTISKEGDFTFISHREVDHIELVEYIIKILERTKFEPAKINGIKVTLETDFPIRLFMNY